jgi:hypothetical protein
MEAPEGARASAIRADPLIEKVYGVRCLLMHSRALKALIFTLALCGVSHASEDAGEVSFQREVLPLLSRSCFPCHGPDGGQRKAKLRFDLREDAVKERDGMRAISPGKAEESELFLRVTDELDPMPPEGHGAPLTPVEVGTLKRWIDEGALYLPHWSLVAPARPDVPSSRVDKSPIDRFVDRALKERALTPNSSADKSALLRRISLDLIGLPPTLEEHETFLSDKSPQAFERVVDRLLASASYGEHWASMWLDLARYADSKGHGSDPLRDIWRYRDWVIEAFNSNKPFDEFTIEQLAGDLLVEPTLDQRLATAFHRNTMVNTEGGTDNEEFRVLAVKDRAKTTAQVWMGMTLGCCECHDHKYDALSQEEFYSFYAIFNQTVDADADDDSPRIETPTLDQQRALNEINVRAEAARDELKTASAPGTSSRMAWDRELSELAEAWQPASLKSADAANGTKLELAGQLEAIASGASPAVDTYTIELALPPGPMKGLRIDALTGSDGSGPGRTGHGNFVLNDLRATLVQAKAKVPTARFVRIENPGPQRILSLAEVEVFSAGINLAHSGETRQSSVAHNGPAKLAVDGDTNGDHFAGSVTHTGTEADPWWELDLGSEHAIDSIKLWNRTDGGQEPRLRRCHVILLDEERAPVWHTRVVDAPRPSVSLQTNASETELGFSLAMADFEQTGWEISKAIDLDPGSASGWAISPQMGEDHVAAFSFLEPVSTTEGSSLRLELTQAFGTEHTFERLRFFTTALNPTLVTDELRAAAEAEDPNEQQEQLLKSSWQETAPEAADLRERIALIEAEREDIKGQLTPVMIALDADKQRKTHRMVLGNFLQPAEEVHAQTPACLPPITAETPTRLDLARWLVSEEHPLTARVTVNRFWSRLMGRGFVSTEEDFGTQGSQPTHPELLDWLALEFIDGDWDVKALLKQLVMTETYKRSSVVTAEGLDQDPLNLWLARGARHRLTAEAVRDQALFVSGLLNDKLYGPSIYPPQPAGLWRAAFNGTQYAPTMGEARHRRGLYVVLRRTIPHPSMVAFDAPSREQCVSRRHLTNTPLQAFVTLNDPVFVEAAQSLARRIIKEGGDTVQERVRYALRLCLLRDPTSGQVATLENLYDTELGHYRLSGAAEALAASTDPLGPLPAGVEAAKAAAWTIIASVLLNMDSFLVRS